jgi:hypothetical protein
LPRQADDPRKHTMRILFVRFRVISRIVLVQAKKTHETRTPPGD